MVPRLPVFRLLGAAFALVMLVALGACRERRNDFSLDEFAEASGVVYWKIQVPSDLGENELPAIAWFRGEELVRPQTAFFNAQAGSVIRAYLWLDDDRTKKKFVWFETWKDSSQSRSNDAIVILDGYTLFRTAPSGVVLKEGDALVAIHHGPTGQEDVCELKIFRRQRIP